MKRKIVLLLCVIFICLCFFGCDDEFGCLNMHARWYIYLPKEQIEKVYEIRGTKIIESDTGVPESETVDSYIIECSDQLSSRRNYVDECLVKIELKNGEVEFLKPKIEIPYLQDGVQTHVEFLHYSEKFSDPVKYIFYYHFYRTI